MPSQVAILRYNASHRKAEKRYATARNLAYALEHLDEVCIDEPAEREEKHQYLSWLQDALFFAPLALIPAMIFTLLFYFSRHG